MINATFIVKRKTLIYGNIRCTCNILHPTSKTIVMSLRVSRIGESWGMANTFLSRPINTKKYFIYVIIIMLHKEHINFYPETHFYRHNCCRYEVMAHKRRWRCSAITCIAVGKCERIYMCNECIRLPNFHLLIISLFMERILFVSY